MDFRLWARWRRRALESSQSTEKDRGPMGRGLVLGLGLFTKVGGPVDTATCCACASLDGLGLFKLDLRAWRFFYFLFFYFRFLQKYIFVFEIYRNIPGRPTAGRPEPGRPTAGGSGFSAKIFAENLC